jgi:hypothetical protein
MMQHFAQVLFFTPSLPGTSTGEVLCRALELELGL